MATEVIKLVGTAYWARVYEPDTAFGTTKFSIQLYPESQKEWDIFDKSGIQKEKKEDENGKFIRFDRHALKMIAGAAVQFTGPVVEDENGDVIVDYVSKMTGKRVYSHDASKKEDVERRGKPILIGNGSKVEVSVAVYDTFKGKGSRLEKVRILDLIEYKSNSGEAPKLSSMVTGDNEAPKEEVKTENKKEKVKAPW